MSDEIRPSDAAAADWDAISRVVAGESDAVESAAVAQWFATHPEDAALAAIVKAQADRAATGSMLSVDTERALSAVRRRMTERPSLTVHRGGAAQSSVAKPAAATRRWRGPVLAAAAALSCLQKLQNFKATALRAFITLTTAVLWVCKA